MSQLTAHAKFLPCMEGFFDGEQRHYVLYGGRGSGKSWDVAQNLVLWAMEGFERILCCREFQTSIKQSVKKLIENTIDRLGVRSLFKITDKAIFCPATMSEFLFAGLWNNFENIKSTEGITIAWIEEAQTVSEQSVDVLTPTVRAPGSFLIYTMNPRLPSDYVYTKFIAPKETPRGVRRINVNWRENPWFPDVLMDEMEAMKEINYSKYLHIWEGELMVDDEALVFRGNVVSAYFEPPEDTEFMFGCDFGFSNDPLSITRSYRPPDIAMIDDLVSQRKLYIDQEASGTRIEIDDHPAVFDTLPGIRQWPIIADSARPEIISYLKRRGFNIKGAEKGQGSVEDGISWLQSQKIIIHPRCENALWSFMTYKFKRHSQTNLITRIPEHEGSDCVDGVRYAWESQWQRRRFMVDA